MALELTPSQPSQPTDALRAITQCPWCEQQFKDLQVYLLAEQESLQLFHFQCQSCQVNILAVVSIAGLVVTSVGVVSDLERADVHSFLHNRPLQADDVLQLHQILGQPQHVRQFKTIKSKV